jgi:hypothetical protein
MIKRFNAIKRSQFPSNVKNEYFKITSIFSIIIILALGTIITLSVIKVEIYAQKSISTQDQNQTQSGAQILKDDNKPQLNSLQTASSENINNTFIQQNKKFSAKFTVIVQITNNKAIDEIGTSHIFIDDTNISKVLNGVNFPAKKTITKTFEFNSKDVPVGKSFTVEVVYGDDIFKRVYGKNTPANTPEVVKIVIP